MKIGDLVTFKIDHDSECIEDIGIVTRIERDPPDRCDGVIATIAWSWGPERHRTSGLQVLSEHGDKK